MKKKLLALIVVSTISLANADTGAYVGANIGFANIERWWSAGTALTINGGYNFNSYFALDGGATWISPINSQYTINGTLPAIGYTQNQSFADIAAKGSLPLSDIFNFYAKLGAGVGYASSSINMTSATGSNWNGDSSAYNLGIYMALGGELKLGKNWGITFDDYGLMPLNNNGWGNINVFGVGAKYNFN